MPIKFLNDVAVDSSVLYVDTINNRVGIGIATPAVKFHVGSVSTSGTTTEEFRLQSGTSSGNGGTAIANLVTGNFGTSGIYFGNNTTYSSQPAFLQYQRSSNVTTLKFDSRFNIDQGVSGTRFTINSSGNVGIGTTSPAAKLEVEGSDHLLQVSSLSATGNPYISFNQQGVRKSFIQHNDSGDYLKLASEYGGISFFTGTGGTETQKMTILSGGNVGIGTTSPSYKLDVDGEARFGDNGGVLLTDDSGTSYVRALNNHLNLRTTRDADDIYFSTGTTTTTKMFIQGDTGNVGIGTTSPGQKLEVEGNIRLSKSNDVTSGFELGRDGSTLDAFIIQRENADLFFRTNNSEKMRIAAGGNVGIGDTGPDAKLTVFRSDSTYAINLSNTEARAGLSVKSSSSFDSKLTISSGASSRQYIQAVNNAATTGRDIVLNPYGGNVGIGTTSPAYLLDVNEDDNVLAFRVTGGGGGAPMASFVRDVGATGSQVNINAQSNFPQIQFTNTGNTFSIGGDTSGNFKISDNTSIGTNDRITIDNTGNVGIGTTSPNQKLTIKGTDQYVAAEQTNYVWGGTNTIGVRMGTDATAGLLDFRRWTGTATTHGTALITQVNSDGGYGLDFRVDTKTSNTVATTSRMFLSQSGEVGIGTTSPSQKLHVNGSVQANIYYMSGTSTSILNFFGYIDLQASNGVLVRSGSTYKPITASAFNVSSDYRLKSNIVPLENAIDRLNQLEVRRFNWNDRLDEPKVDGFIAHEVAPIIPEAVLGEKDAVYEDGTPNHQGIDQAKIVPLLTAALQEAISKIENLEARIQILENQ